MKYNTQQKAEFSTYLLRLPRNSPRYLEYCRRIRRATGLDELGIRANLHAMSVGMPADVKASCAYCRNPITRVFDWVREKYPCCSHHCASEMELNLD